MPCTHCTASLAPAHSEPGTGSIYAGVRSFIFFITLLNNLFRTQNAYSPQLSQAVFNIMTLHLPLCTPKPFKPTIYTISNSPFSFFMKFGKHLFKSPTRRFAVASISPVERGAEHSQHFVYPYPKFHRNELVAHLPSVDFFAMCLTYRNYVKDIFTSFPSSVLT